MKYFLYILIPLILLFPVSAQAHILEVDGTIGGVIHVDPEDDPIVGVPSHGIIEFKDTAGHLDLADCNCVLTISSADTTDVVPKESISLKPLELSFTYTFPKRAIYTISITGTSIEGTFQPFTLTYPMRVDREEKPEETQSLYVRILNGHGIHYVLLGGGIIASAIVVISDKRKQKKV